MFLKMYSKNVVFSYIKTLLVKKTFTRCPSSVLLEPERQTRLVVRNIVLVNVFKKHNNHLQKKDIL